MTIRESAIQEEKGDETMATVSDFQRWARMLGCDQEGIDAAAAEHPRLTVEIMDYRHQRGGNPPTALGSLSVSLARPDGRTSVIVKDSEFSWAWGSPLPQDIQAHIDGFKAAMRQQYGDAWLYELQEV